MASNENVFNFDVAPFIAGINKLGAGMDRIQSNAKRLGDVITSSANKAVNGAIMKVGALIGAFKAAGAVLKSMPEVGQAFGIAKDIFLKNLLWPLRQQVMPLLQKMLDWVRDHRARFVTWGVAIANVFRTVIVVAKTLWDVFKSLVDTVSSAFQKALGTSFKTFDEFVNVFSFKISAVIIYLGLLAKEVIKDLRPAFEWIIEMGSSIIDFFLKLGGAWATANKNGDSLFTLADKLGKTFKILAGAVQAAWEGFKEGFLSSSITNAMTPLNQMADSINRLLELLGLDDTKGVRGAFKGLATILGTGLQGALATVAAVFDSLVTALGTLGTLFNMLNAFVTGDLVGAAEEFKKVGSTWKDWTGRQKINFQSVITAPEPGAQNAAGGQRSPISVHDAIITKGGQVIHTDPDDNLVATKTMPAIGGGGRAPQGLGQVTMGPFYITTTEGDARATGEKFGTGLADGFRMKVSTARLLEGY